MSHSTTLLDLIVQSQASKEVTANAMFDAGSPSTLFGRRGSLCSGLNWFYFGGVMVVDGVLTSIANNTAALALSASTTNYIEATRAGVVSKNTTGFTAGSIPLYTVVTGSATVSSYTDNRAWVQPTYQVNQTSITVTTADVTITDAQARCDYLTINGLLTGNRAVIVPDYWHGEVYCNNTGAYTTTVKTSGGSGVVVGQAKRCILRADGSVVVRITADV